MNIKKTSLLILLAALFLWGCSEKSEVSKTEQQSEFLTREKIQAHLKNRQDSSKWDMELFQNDLNYGNNSLGLPFINGVFPVPDYDLIGKGSFKGVGNAILPGGDSNQLNIEDKTILSNAFFVKSSMVNEKHLKNRKDEIFFQVLVLTDFIDTVNYSHLQSEISSRNHPDYIGQGFFKTKNKRIDYMAFLTADRNSYAIINMRLFDLTLGKTILIAPQKDGSFRSMQIDSPELSSETSGNYLKKLVKRKEVTAFFTQKGTI